MNEVVLVDRQDRPTGTLEKLEAHRQGVLHRAISVFVFNSKGELMLQRRAQGKYHSEGLWTNTCCSHPYPGEPAGDAARRRVKEEMGLDIDPVFSHAFVYKGQLDKGLTEFEYDHVFTAVTDAIPDPDPAEASEWKFISMSALRADARLNPGQYTLWLRIILEDPSFRF